MARRKEEIAQADFSLGAVRQEAIERDDTALITQSVAAAKNTIGLSSGAIQVRPGLVEIGTTDSISGVEVDLGSGRVFDLHIIPTGLILYDEAGAVEASFTSSTWTSIAGKWGTPVFEDVKFWVVADPDSSSIMIGAKDFPIQALVVDDAGVWTFGTMDFATKENAAVLQPYWNYDRGIVLLAGARTGTTTLTADVNLWVAAHNGMRLRFAGREIVLGSVVSATVINCTITEELPPDYLFTLGSTSGYQIGEAVEHNTLGGQGIIYDILTGTTLLVRATVLWDGFAASGKLIGPNASQAISGSVVQVGATTEVWDMQMQSPIHGYAGWAVKHKGRAYLCAFPGAPQAFAASSAGFVDDFTLGIDDGDGFVETIGANAGGDLRFMVSAEDLLFFTSKGLYYQGTRDGSPITPLTIGPVSFASLGCADVAPIAVSDGAVFVDAAGSQMYAAMLSGDIYRAWKAQGVSKFHAHLVTGPVKIGATQFGSETPEEFIYVINSDGTAAVAQWDRDSNKIGWRPWETAGTFLDIYQVFGKTQAVVNRVINAVSTTFREKFVEGITMDCVASLKVSGAFPAGEVGATYFGGVTKAATHLDGHDGTVYFEGWDIGDRLINSSGQPLDDAGNVIVYPVYDGILQIGLKFDVVVTPWPRRSINTYRGLRDVKRTTKMMFTVQDTLQFTFDGQSFGGYFVGEDTSIPPPLRTREVAFITGGRDHFEARDIVVDRPGPFRLLKVKYRVTV